MAERTLFLGILLNMLYLGLAITAVTFLIKIYKLLSKIKKVLK
ncbi:TPA: hypothetical protein ACGO63_001265 [Streptococcus suis]|uniref:Uncharacterized protein n=1 Tax=Streptococcus suis TaxID=1307 RepID=A0A0Z8EI90_STRSU|nr:Uncharacterised protein [Streptococcus suis]CYX32461.1 Uncharacterised protein [Streptococcus suis]